MTSRRRFLGAAAAAAATYGAGLPARAATPARTITIAFPMDVPSWDPVVAAQPTVSAVYKCVFDQPLNLADDLSFAPSVVRAHQWLDERCTQLELELRDDVGFHNGDRLTSADIQFTFDERVKADRATLLSGVWRGVDRVETPAPTRAIMHFAAPMATAPVMLADIPAYILPKAYYQSVGADGFVKAPVGSGPYRLAEYQRDAQIVLERTSDYWGGAPAIERVVFRITKDATARAAAIQSGQADVTMNLSVREVERLGALPGLAPHLDPTTGVVLIQLVNAGVLQDRNVRLAAHHALDKRAISRALFNGHATSIWVPAGPTMPGYVDGFEIPYSPDQARALLAASGHGPDNPVRFNFYTTRGTFPSDFDIARVITQMWRQVGIEADLQVLDGPTMYDYQRNGKFDGPVLKPFNPAGGDPGTYSGYMLDPAMSFSIWKGEDIPPRLYPLMAEPDNDKRISGFRDFDRWQVEQGYSIPLFLGLTTIVAREQVGFRPHPSGVLLPYRWG
ncbi:hypothetical protein FOZ76_07235 [Verticiella sediminum]|uniref:Solute-binding protein family 5 domain-containing protein n=1 Tax=Verticiella sediminum TaxID=1247510 RepID=A0A556AW03_9BURK|nr:ABC transporter substrate-binding protein [Verticiella sediminum]TSH97104.1 hypothetical protein FOZ76_07235 [Verticiella sediminum]